MYYVPAQGIWKLYPMESMLSIDEQIFTTQIRLMENYVTRANIIFEIKKKNTNRQTNQK